MRQKVKYKKINKINPGLSFMKEMEKDILLGNISIKEAEEIFAAILMEDVKRALKRKRLQVKERERENDKIFL